MSKRLAPWRALFCLLVHALLAVGCTSQPLCGAWLVDGVSLDGDMCESRLRDELTISEAFTPEQQSLIIAGGDAWRVATAGRADILWTIGEPADVRVGCEFGRAGAYPSSGTLCFEVYDLESLRARSIHELGHHFGLGHDPTPQVVMRPGVDDDNSVTARDLEHFNQLWEARR